MEYTVSDRLKFLFSVFPVLSLCAAPRNIMNRHTSMRAQWIGSIGADRCLVTIANPTVLAVDLLFWLTNLLPIVSARLFTVFFYFILLVYNILCYCSFSSLKDWYLLICHVFRASFWLDISIVVYATRVSLV